MLPPSWGARRQAQLWRSVGRHVKRPSDHLMVFERPRTATRHQTVVEKEALVSGGSAGAAIGVEVAGGKQEGAGLAPRLARRRVDFYLVDAGSEEEAPAAMPSRGQVNPRRGISVSSRRGWGPGASEKLDRDELRRRHGTDEWHD
jgi:hypothetical protein